MSINGHTYKTTLKIQKELENDAWIQCERETCLKWRRVTAEIAERYENDPWFCEFNHDKNFNRYRKFPFI